MGSQSYTVFQLKCLFAENLTWSNPERCTQIVVFTASLWTKPFMHILCISFHCSMVILSAGVLVRYGQGHPWATPHALQVRSEYPILYFLQRKHLRFHSGGCTFGRSRPWPSVHSPVTALSWSGLQPFLGKLCVRQEYTLEGKLVCHMAPCNPTFIRRTNLA